MRNVAGVGFVRWAIRLAVSLGCAACAAGVAGATNLLDNAAAPAAQLTSPFAVADFDGDSQLDIATVQSGQFGSFETKYWIHFQLSSGPRQFIAVNAPIGGLRIAPRDVNGDNALDLVLTSAGQQRLVAVLLNDGRGHFTLSEPRSFSASFWEAESSWAAARSGAAEIAAVLTSQNFSGCSLKTQRLPSPSRGCSSFFSSASRKPGFVLTASVAGRAPPYSALHV